MTLFDKIEQQLSSFTKGERLAAEYILKYPIDVLRYSAEAIGDNANTSRSNVVRLCKKLGFSGFSEFKYELKYTLYHSPEHIVNQAKNKNDLTQTFALDKFISCFWQLKSFHSSLKFNNFAQSILSANKICIIGYYHSYFSANQLSFRLNRFGIDAKAMYDESIITSYTDILTTNDLLIMFSISGSKKYTDMIKAYKKNGVTISLITMTENAPISRYADHVLLLPCITRQYTDTLLDDAPIFYLFIELLMEKLSSLKH